MLKPKNISKKAICSLLLLPLVASQLFLSAPVFAGPTACGDNCSTNGGPSGNTTPTSTSVCQNTLGSNGQVSQSKVDSCLNQSPVVHDIQNIVNFLSAGVGIIVIAVIILGGVQYSMAGDNANATGAAKTRITNGLMALFAFIFSWAFLQWLIPGGIFG